MNKTKRGKQDYLQLQQQLIHYKSEISKYKHELASVQNKLLQEREKTEYYKAVIRTGEQYRIAKEQFEQEIQYVQSKLKEAEKNAEKMNMQLSIVEEERNDLLKLLKAAVTNLLKEKQSSDEKINQLLLEKERLITQLDKRLEKEQFRIDLLTAERNELLNTSQFLFQSLYEKHVEQKEVDAVGKENTAFMDDPIRARFIHSIVLPHENGDPVTILGHAEIENITEQTLHHPVLCIKIHPHQHVQFSGKIITTKKQNENDFNYKTDSSMEWKYLHPDWRKQIQEKGEYWLKPSEKMAIEPYEKISFEGFHIVFPLDDFDEALVIEGFVYCQEKKNGIPFENKIIIN
ncbi:hypothetical protein CX649_07030 [Bacillaceae bacterium ZC4]|jgi:hypothetical protein|uniref:hypothetical protein n=1 Tax=Aeribacillus TaxID=1055323 RepID=UPI00118D1A76|nr:hypothetical protein CX649_07030 [Bacillaceae bacterium ZC4]MED1437633.1 hypothetical protein [Aeribacillus composti]